MKKTLFLLITMALGVILHAQVTDKEADLKAKDVLKDTTEGWKHGGTIALNLTQVSLTNWAAGGQNSISTNGLVNLFAIYRKGNNTWENYFSAAYGTVKQGKKANWWKTDDKIEFTSKYGRKAFSNWYYAVLFNFKTQMTPGYNYPDDSNKISDLFAPAYIIGAIGMDYDPNEHFSAFIAPLTSKITIVKDKKLSDVGAFGVDSGKTIRSEFGGYVRLFYKNDIMKNIGLQTKLDLFSNYLHNPQNIDINWEVLLSMKINKYFSVTITTQLLYDDDIDIDVDTNGDGIVDERGPRTQFKEVLGIGFTYKF